MSETTLTPEERFADLVDEFAPHPDVTPPMAAVNGRKPFGAMGLKVRGKIFAMLYGQRLTLKLPAARVTALLAEGAGERFDPRRDGRAMKQWIVLAPSYLGDWLSLAREALEFVRAEQA